MRTFLNICAFAILCSSMLVVLTTLIWCAFHDGECHVVANRYHEMWFEIVLMGIGMPWAILRLWKIL